MKAELERSLRLLKKQRDSVDTAISAIEAALRALKETNPHPISATTRAPIIEVPHVVDEPDTSEQVPAKGTMTDMILQAMREADRPVRVADLLEILPDMNEGSMRVTLWKLKKRDMVKQIDRSFWTLPDMPDAHQME